MIELRSDTFTLPTPEMLAAIQQATLGDDVYGEDRTVNQLEAVAAEIFGKEAALLVPSGTMANLIALMTHCPRGTKALVGNESDLFIYEAGGASVCGGIVYEPVPTQADGRLSLEDLQRVLPDDLADPEFALPALICLENTHCRTGGRVLPLSYLHDVQVFARQHRLAVHIDGARIFNAAVALQVGVDEIAQYADSVQFCLSKGLSAPVGSMIVGERDFIRRARRLRKMLGGGMRQAGIIAAPGLISLQHMTRRLAEDHANALRLAQGLSTIPGIQCTSPVETNMVFFRVVDDRFSLHSFLAEAALQGVNMAELGYGRVRAVTHAGISEQDIHSAVDVIRRIISRGPTEASVTQ